MSTPAGTDQSAGDRSLGDLISDVTQDLSTLLRQELELAKAELQQSAARAGRGAGLLGGAGVAGYFVLLFLSIALWWLIGAATGLGWAALLVAVIWAVIAAILAITGRNALKSVRGVPRTADTVRRPCGTQSRPRCARRRGRRRPSMLPARRRRAGRAADAAARRPDGRG